MSVVGLRWSLGQVLVAGNPMVPVAYPIFAVPSQIRKMGLTIAGD
jgi:hypothetical protein